MQNFKKHVQKMEILQKTLVNICVLWVTQEQQKQQLQEENNEEILED